MSGKALAIKAAIKAVRDRRLSMQSHGVGYNPPLVPQRGVELDYPQHVPGMGIDRSIEGVPLDALYVAGRRGANAEDQAIGPEQLISAASSLAGVDRARLKGDYGQFKKVAGPNGGEYVIRIDKDKVAESSPQEYRVLAHEFGHLTDEAAAQIDQRGVESELRKVYHELNATPDERRKRGLIGPQHRRYSKKDQPAEMMAEAVAGYLMNPNWMKATAPNLAKRIRQWANVNPRTRRIIQFNEATAGAGVVVGAAGMAPGDSMAASDKSPLLKNSKTARYRTGRNPVLEHHYANLDSGKVVRNPDGSVSTVKTIVVNYDGKDRVIPTIWDGVELSSKDSIKRAIKSGKDWPAFATPEEAMDSDKLWHQEMRVDFSMPSNMGEQNNSDGTLRQKRQSRELNMLRSVNAESPQQTALELYRQGYSQSAITPEEIPALGAAADATRQFNFGGYHPFEGAADVMDYLAQRGRDPRYSELFKRAGWAVLDVLP